MTTFGIECEVAHGGAVLAQVLHDRGLAYDNEPHPYHCRTAACCSYTRATPWTVQQDCTCGGEAISHILEWGTGHANEAIAGLARAMADSRVTIDATAGNHVHVGHDGHDEDSIHRMYRLFLRYQDYELTAVAQASLSGVRTYNAKVTHQWCARGADNLFWQGATEPKYQPRGRWVEPESATFEFRLWNSTRMEWRLYLHAALSVAIMDAARDGVWVEKNDRRSLATVLGDHLDTRAMSYLTAQLDHAGFTGR